MTAPAIVHLTRKNNCPINVGADFSMSFGFEDDGEAVDFSEATITGEIRTAVGDGDLIATFTCTGDSDGIVTISLDHTVTAALGTELVAYPYDVFADINGTVSKILAGRIEIVPSVTEVS